MVKELDNSSSKSQNLKQIIMTLVKIVLLTFVFMMVMGISSGIAGMSTEGIVADPMQVMGPTLLVFFLQTIALSLVIIRSKLSNLHLTVLVISLYFGLSVFLVQIETLVFLEYFTSIIDPLMVSQLFIQGGLTSLIFSPLAVIVLRGRKGSENMKFQSIRFGMSKIQGLAKISSLAIIFVIFYIFFGIFVAWANPALGAYYGDLITQMAEVGSLMLLLQAGRAVVFIALAFPVIRTMKGVTLEKALVVAFLFTVLTAANLLIPTAIMPDSVRMSHFVEVAIPAFIFGLLVVWLMHRSHKSFRNLISSEANKEPVVIED
jgi:hypothetical protein